MTPQEVTDAIKAKLRRHADFTHLSVHTQAAMGGRFNVCTVIIPGDHRERLRVANIVGEHMMASWIHNTRGAVVLTIPKEYVIR